MRDTTLDRRGHGHHRWSHDWQQGGPILVARTGLKWSHARGRRHPERRAASSNFSPQRLHRPLVHAVHTLVARASVRCSRAFTTAPSSRRSRAPQACYPDAVVGRFPDRAVRWARSDGLILAPEPGGGRGLGSALFRRGQVRRSSRRYPKSTSSAVRSRTRNRGACARTGAPARRSRAVSSGTPRACARRRRRNEGDRRVGRERDGG